MTSELGTLLSELFKPDGTTFTKDLDRMRGTVSAAGHVLQLRTLARMIDTRFRLFELTQLRGLGPAVCGKVAALRSEIGSKLSEVVGWEENKALMSCQKHNAGQSGGKVGEI